MRSVVSLSLCALFASCQCGILDPSATYACTSTADCAEGYECGAVSKTCVTEPENPGAMDAGVDGGTDAGVDAGVDTGTDAGVDAGTDAGIDAGIDAGTDAGMDAGIDAGIDAGLPWWNAAWRSRQQLTVRNSASSPLGTGYQLGFPLNLPTLGMPGALDEVRLVRWNATTRTWTELTRVIDDDVQPWLWARLTGPIAINQADSTYYLYFDNPSAPAAPSNPSLVFEFYEAMSGALSATWLFQGAGMPGNGLTEFRLDFGESIRTSTTWGPRFAVDFVLRQPVYAGRFWGGFQEAGTFAPTEPWIIWIARNTSSPAEIWPEFCDQQPTILEGMPRRAMSTTAHRYGIDRFADRVVSRYDNAPLFDQALGASYVYPLNIRFTNESAQSIFVSQVRVRQTVYPFPSVTAGVTEP